MSLDVSLTLTRGTFRLNVNFSAPGHGITALYGVSGAGKTTLLRALAGLETNAQGQISVNGQLWQSPKQCLPPHQRAVGYVFQEASLFPHLSVQGNLDYALKRAHPARRNLNRNEVIRLLGLEPFLGRPPHTLSGGERQRVALARALLSGPRLLLMDEPLAALDMSSKADILPYLERLHDILSIPVLYVSHAAEELARLADHLLVMERGRISAQGPLNDILTALEAPLAQQEDAFSVLQGRVITPRNAHHLTLVALGRHEIRLPRVEAKEGQGLRLRVYARDVSLCLDPPGRTSILNVLPARIVAISPARGDGQRLIRLMIDDQPLLAHLTEYSCAALGLEPGLSVYAQIKALALLR
ncbi:molybdenum ABC transporter ATP-binding protein [Luteithermobacter gelatinilyticus]|uniref:molybdenum ABC transporter ATP-binding protein n=1 Tax=Luteithermobacter gelatinilyticus TaxID=2582913 RepID=UPI001105B922|nr:molybdenum ABC transporter ATP-binding protein [Luteithermobacter gelatinilyticus]